jgi:tellurite resistance protein TerA
MARSKNSSDSLKNASTSTDKYTEHGHNTQGAAGVIDSQAVAGQDALDKSGESGLIHPPENGFDNIHIGLAWDNMVVEKAGGFMGLIKKMQKQGVDLDLGCFFELTNGTRGVLQPFGNLFGALDKIPYIKSSGDERTGDADGDDEVLTINGQKWPEIKRVLIYTYIYKGAVDWSKIKPEVNIKIIDSEAPIIIKPGLKTTNMTVCALATIHNVKNSIQIKTHGEYFTSQAAMDRAFGYGLEWEDGAKD